MKKQAGFTLIELVMVIVILGILAAVALPKFVNLGSDARTAAMKGVEGSMRSTNAMIYAKAAVANKMGASASLTTSDFPGASKSIDLNYGYAVGALGLSYAMDLSSDFTVTGTNMQIYHIGAQDTTKCYILYAPATAVGNAVTPPTYQHDYTGC